MEWISVKDGLPKVDTKVIVWNTEYPDIEFMKMGYYDPSSGTKTGWRCGEYMDLHVTHWMPLPQPPEEKT
jgi:hypothetical protein